MAKKYTKLSETLRKLLFNRNMRAVDLSREVNLPPPTIHRLLTGKSSRPYTSSLEPIATYFGITIEELVGENVQNETIFNPNTSFQNIHLLHKIPLLSWEELGVLDREKANDKIPFVGPISEKAFATTMHDFSMEPILARGSILIFDPERQEKDRSYVIVELAQKETIVVRQLIFDGNARYLKSLNNDLHSSQIRALTSHDKTLGVLVECRTPFDDF